MTSFVTHRVRVSCDRVWLCDIHYILQVELASWGLTDWYDAMDLSQY